MAMDRKGTICCALGAFSLAVVGAAAAAPAVSASSAQYRGCDGYGAASDSGDGMTEYARVLFIFNPPGYGNTDRSTTQSGQTGVADCDAALADLPARHWMRKVSLLRARAIHYLQFEDTSAALADLDSAETAANNSADPFYGRSLGWGLGIVRAYAIRRTGDQARATSLAMQALSLRPYNRQSVYSALLAMGPGADAADLETVQDAMARLIPAYVDVLYIKAFETGQFAKAISIYTQLTPPEEIGSLNIYGGDRAGRNWRNFRTAELFWASRTGSYAYALAATGDEAQARAAIEAGRTKLANDTQPPPPLSAKEAQSAEAVALRQGDADIRVQSAAEGTKTLNLWSSLVDLRVMIGEGKTADAIKTMKSETLPRSWASVDLMDALEVRLPKAQKPAQPASQTLRAELAKLNHDVPDARPSDFLRDLPEAETTDRIPSYSEASRPWFGHSDDAVSGRGFRVGKTNEQGVTVVRFNGGVSAPASVVEEMALLRAAEFARQSGRKGLIVVGREDIHTTITTTYYATPLRTDPGGYETALRVVLVDPGVLPIQYQNAAWRVLDADAIYAALAPLYIKPSKTRR
jgi:hypothetical protein